MAEEHNQDMFWGQISYSHQRLQSEAFHYEPAYDVSPFDIPTRVRFFSLEEGAWTNGVDS
jgi:hypothetical protein